MAITEPKDLKPIGNENSYTEEFFENLYNTIDIKDDYSKKVLKKAIRRSAQRYMSRYGDHQREVPSGEIKKELQKASNNIKKAGKSIGKVISSGNYSDELVDNLHEVISNKYTSLHSLLGKIKKEGGENSPTINSPLRSLSLLAAMHECIDLTLKNNPSKNATPKSAALNDWIMILSAKLEPIIGHKLEQSRYHNGEYISKREIGDSELLLSIIKPLDPNVTISQIETEIKKTHKERHNAPWDDYFPNI